MTREQSLWKMVKPHLPGHAERVENVAVPGFPDVNGCFNGVEYWVELKVTKTKTYNIDKLLEDSQRVWIFRRLRLGGHVLILVRCGKVLTIYQPEARTAGLNFSKSISFSIPVKWSNFTEIFNILIEA